MNHCIKHPELAEEGQQILTRTILNMPVLDLQVVRLKLGAMGIHFDKQTDEQKEYARQFVVHT